MYFIQLLQDCAQYFEKKQENDKVGFTCDCIVINIKSLHSWVANCSEFDVEQK